MTQVEQRAGAAVEATALWTAAVRAAERARDDRLFDDPWADALAGDEGRAWIEGKRPESYAPIAIRTRYFDDWLASVVGAGIRQVVVLAAGFDTRAYRLTWPDGLRWFEVDRPGVLRHKSDMLAGSGGRPRCDHHAVVADLADPAWPTLLREAGFDPGRPAAFLLEGFLFYLPNETIAGIVDAVSSLAVKGSRLGFDIVDPVTLTSPYTQAWLEMQAAAGAPWIGSMTDPAAFLAARGWVASLTQPGQPDASFGRWTLPVYPVHAPGLPHNWYVTAVKG